MLLVTRWVHCSSSMAAVTNMHGSMASTWQCRHLEASVHLLVSVLPITQVVEEGLGSCSYHTCDMLADPVEAGRPLSRTFLR